MGIEKFEELQSKYSSLFDDNLNEEFMKNFVKLRIEHLMMKYISKTIEKNNEYIKTVFNFIDAYYPLFDIDLELSIWVKQLNTKTINKEFQIENFISKDNSNDEFEDMKDYDGEEKRVVISELLLKKCEISDLSMIAGIYKYNIHNTIVYKFISLGIDEDKEKICQYVAFAKIDKDGKFYDVFRQLNPSELETELIEHQDIDLDSFYKFDLCRDRIFRSYDIDELKPISSWDIRIPVYKLYYIKEDKRKDLFKAFNCNYFNIKNIKHYELSYGISKKCIEDLYSVISFMLKIVSPPKEFEDIVKLSRTINPDKSDKINELTKSDKINELTKSDKINELN